MIHPPPPGVEFLGEVGVSDFINGLELATAIDLTAGYPQHTTEPWLHFVLDGVVLYVAKKPYRSHISWDHINAVGAVFGSKTVTINDKTYKVRLLKSSPEAGNIYTGSGGWDPVEAYGSEWNRIMYPIHSGEHTYTQNPTPVSGEGIHFGSLAQYSDTDLVLHKDVGNGYANWCQETRSTDSRYRVDRCRHGVSYLSSPASWFADSYYGWRPVLELIE